MYATYAQVKARAGRFGTIFEVAGKHPDQADIESILTSLAGEIDAAIRSRGFDPTTLDDSVKAGLVDLNAYGALVRALPEANPGPEADRTLAIATRIWEEGIAGILDGTYPALAELLAGRGGQVSVRAGIFQEDESDYDPLLDTDLSPEGVFTKNARLRVPNIAPSFHKGQKL